jgi:hypothetical protein
MSSCFLSRWIGTTRCVCVWRPAGGLGGPLLPFFPFSRSFLMRSAYKRSDKGQFVRAVAVIKYYIGATQSSCVRLVGGNHNWQPYTTKENNKYTTLLGFIRIYLYVRARSLVYTAWTQFHVYIQHYYIFYIHSYSIVYIYINILCDRLLDDPCIIPLYVRICVPNPKNSKIRHTMRIFTFLDHEY